MSLVADGVIALGQPGESAGDDSPGGPEVSELERENGESLMPGGSQLGEFRACSLPKATTGPDQSRKSSGVRKWEGIDLIPDEEIATSKKRTLRSDVAKQREMADAAKKNETEDGQEEVQVQKKRVLGSGVAKKREGGSTPAKKVAAEAMLGADQNGSSSVISESDATKLVTCEKEITDYEKRILSLDVAEQREGSDTSETDAEEEAGTSKKKVREDAATKEIAAGSVNGNGCAIIIERKDPDESEQETRVGMKRITRSDADGQWVLGEANKVIVEKKRSRRSHSAKGRKEAKTNKNESDGDKRIATEDATPGAGQNGKCSAISNRNTVDLTKCDEVVKVEKRITRSDVAKQREEAETIQKEVMESEIGRKRSFVAFDVETTSKRFKVESSRCRLNEDGQKDDLSEKKMKSDLKKIRRLEYERYRWIKCSSRRTLRGFKGNGTVGVKSTRVPGRGGVLKALSGNKKVVGFEKDHIRRKFEENSKRLRPFSSGNKSASQHPSLYGEGKNLKVLGSFVSLGKHQTSSTEKKSHDSKKGYKPNDLGSSNDKSEAMIKGESCSNSKARAKQKLRDQIKDVLLNAGWKIDLRPRKGRNYEDSVYISPQGSSYWSITKAYDVFQSLMNRTHVDKRKSSPRKSSKTSKGNDHKHEGTGSPFPAIPREALSILKKVFVNKRRSREEIEEANKKREDGSKNKKAKGITCLKHPKNKHFEDNGKDLKDRIQEKNIAVSSAKGVVGYTRKKAHMRKCGEKQRGMTLLVRGSNQETETGTDVSYPWRRTIFSWMIDLGIMPASGRVKYMNCDRTQTMLEGWITRNGIHCSCCSTILTVSKFEIHAGGKLCQPYQNIYLEDIGISLMQCQLNTWEKQGESVRQSFYPVDIDGDDPNDDTCGICGDGGDLICCDGCPSTFHLSCLGIQMLPPGVWHCMNCSCRFCGLVASAGPEETDLTVSPLLSCSQCEEKYHLKCVPEGDAMPVCSNLSCLPFCGKSCKRLFEQLRGLLGVKNDLEAGFSWTLLQRFDEDLPESACGLDQRVECNSKIAVALGVMDECFLPIVDQRSGIDLIHNVVYNCGSNFNRLNYRGFYTFILERQDEVISAASLRIHGTRLAEMPFIGTRNIYRRQGMCRRLLNGIESALCSFNVEKLIIPAISELKDTWTNVFGFKPLKVSQKQEIKSINLLVFPGTGLLLKPLLKKSNEHCKTANEAGKIEPCSKYHCTHEVANESTAHSFIGLEADASAEAIVQCVHEAKGKEPGSGVTPESFDGSDGSEYQVLENKPLLSHPEMVYDDEPCSKYHRTHEVAIESTVHSFIALESDASAEAIVQCVHEAKDKEPGSGVTPESFDGSDGSESQVSENKPSDIAANKDLLLHPEMVYHDEPCCKYHRTHEVANESTVHSFIGLEAAASAEAIVQCVHEAKGKEPGSGVAPESSDGSDGSESQVSENKPSDIAANEDLLLHPEMVYHDEPVVGNKFQSDSCLVSEIKLPSEGNAEDNDDATIRGTCVVQNLLVIDDALVQPTSDSICTSPFVSASILRDSGGKTGPILPAVDCTLLPDHNEVQCTSPDAIPSFLQGSGGNDIQISVSSQGLSSDDAHHCRSEVAVTSSGPFPIGNDFQKYSEHIVVDKHNRKDEVATPQPDFRDDLGYFNAEIVAGPLGAVANKFLLPSVEPNIHEVGDYTIQTIHELKGQLAAVRPKTFADGGNGEQCASEIIKTPPDVAPGIENQDFCVISASHGTDIVSVLAASEHSDEGPIQRNSELQQKSTESVCDAVLPSSTKLHHGEHDLVNSLNVTSVPEQFGAYNSEEINDDAGYVGLHLSAYQTTGMVKSVDVASKSNSSDMVYVPTPDEGNCHMVAKDCPLLAPSVTYSWASTKGVVLDNHNVRFQDDAAAASPRAIIEVSNDHAADGISGLNSVVPDYNNLKSGATLNKISDSTGVVQHNLVVTNEDAVSPVLHVTRVESAVKPEIHVFGACSVYDASEVASQFLDNDLQSVLESADVGNVQHNKLSFSSHTSTTGVSPLSTGRGGSCEIHEAVIVSNQGNSLAPRHDSAD